MKKIYIIYKETYNGFVNVINKPYSVINLCGSNYNHMDSLTLMKLQMNKHYNVYKSTRLKCKKNV